ncbi:MAG TPA: AIR synthase related protein [Nitrososphaerales archaeon]|nr:AIR synthase related protein [Nitrososphaerales archaeon]
MRKRVELPEGKLPLNFLEPIIDSIPGKGLLVSKRVGMDAGIVRVDSKKIVFSSGVAQGSYTKISNKLISDLVAKIKLSGATPALINPVVLLPLGTRETEVRQIMLGISKAAKDLGIIVGKGHTEVTSLINETTLIFTIFGFDPK